MVTANSSTKTNVVPLEFVVEIMNVKQNQQVRNIIVARGGKIVDYINEEKLPHMVISDHPITEKLQSMSAIQREKMAARLPLLLRDAIQNKVKILYSDTFLRKISDKRINLFHTKPQHSQKRAYPSDTESSDASHNSFYMRIEDLSHEFQPMMKKMHELPMFHVGEDFGISLFHRADESLRRKRADEIQKEIDGDYSYLDVDSQGALVNKAREKSTAHCEICRKHITNLKEHYRSKEHQKNINRPGFFDELDQYTGSYVPFVKCPGRPQLLRKSKTPSPIAIREDYRYGETDFGKLDEERIDVQL